MGFQWEDKEFKAFLPEEETFDELAPGNPQSDIMERQTTSDARILVKNSLRKAVKMRRCLTWLRNARKGAREEKGFSLSNFICFIFSRRALTFEELQVHYSRCFLNHSSTKVLLSSIFSLTKKSTVPTTRKLDNSNFKNLPYVTPFQVSSAMFVLQLQSWVQRSDDIK